MQFVPLRPASRKRMVMAIVIGPFLWLVALITVAAVLHFTSAIEFGLLIALIAAVLSTIILVLLRQGRIRQERRFAARG